MAPPSASEILSAIKRLKNNKSPREDGLPPEVYKASPHVIAQQLETLFRRGGSDQIFTLRLILQQCKRYNLPIINIFFDFLAAFDSVTHGNLWRIMVEDGMPVEFLELLKAYYEHCRSIVRVLDGEAEPFNVESSAKQGCILCPVLFNYCIDWILERTFSSFDGVFMGSGINVSDLDNTDDIDALAADPATAQAMLNKTAHFSQLLGMKINTAKTKVMDLNIQLDYHLVLYRQELEKN
ncbi:hypothetical protein QYM36_005344 [Artemia franciscana]|uniref:Reverse transcriptase domain-containing protein n=1 Tax=Artemia franciscana TaxID=6661 RepID=A0AA88IFA0_ARTSF|nr:hypothetical protein QYM36_005344 [Artemia franciscana]